MNLSIILPVFNESRSIKILVDEIHSVLFKNYKYEIILIDDGSTDKTWSVISSLTLNQSCKAKLYKSKLLPKHCQSFTVGFLAASLRDR